MQIKEKKDFSEIFEKLRQMYGMHSRVARALGYTSSHYYLMRKGKANITERAEKAITSLLNEQK